MRYAKPIPAMLLSGSLCLLPVLAGAQNVIPPANAATNGNTATYIPFADYNATFQIDFAASQLAGLAPGTAITDLGFRLVAGSTNQPTTDDLFSSYQITLSKSNNSVGSLSSTFADNIGSDAVTVYNSSLTIPANALTGGSGPNPFYDISFASPYVYTGGDLLITLQHTAGSAVGFLLDANSYGDGNADTVGNLNGADSNTAATGTAQFFNYPIVNLSTGVSSVPEPGAYALIASLGLTGAAFLRRKRSR